MLIVTKFDDERIESTLVDSKILDLLELLVECILRKSNYLICRLTKNIHLFILIKRYHQQ